MKLLSDEAVNLVSCLATKGAMKYWMCALQFYGNLEARNKLAVLQELNLDIENAFALVPPFLGAMMARPWMPSRVLSVGDAGANR